MERVKTNIRDILYRSFNLTISNVTSDFKLTLADFTHITSDLKTMDTSLEQFLNLVTSQYIMFNS